MRRIRVIPKSAAALFLCLLVCLCAACGEAEQRPDPPEGYESLEVVEKTEDCIVTYSSDWIAGRSLAPIRLIAQSPCKDILRLDLGPVDWMQAPTFARGLTTVRGELAVKSNDFMRSLDGLESVERALYMTVTENARLETLEGLDSLETVLPRTEEDDWGDPGSVYIAHNDSLRSLEGLESLREVEHLRIEFNWELRSIEALYGLERVDSIVITHSPKLPRCQVDKLIEGLEEPPETVETERLGEGSCP